MFCDAHFHIVQCSTMIPADRLILTGYSACSCAHDINEYRLQQKQLHGNDYIYSSFGVHPQQPVVRNIDFLEHLLSRNELDAVGEAGFDLFTEEYKTTIQNQETAWAMEVELAALYQRPLVVHCRKALDRLFRDSRKLKALPAVVFHSFSGGPVEAMSFLKRDIHAYFSFGKPLLNGSKRAIACIRELPENCLLLETDAPFQTLKGEAYTVPADIRRIYAAAFEIRYTSVLTVGTGGNASLFYKQIENNFHTVYGTNPVRVSGVPAL
jgi:TatD DNase family protein